MEWKNKYPYKNKRVNKNDYFIAKLVWTVEQVKYINKFSKSNKILIPMVKNLDN